MRDIRILSEADVEAALDGPTVRGALERAFVALSEGRSDVAPRTSVTTGTGQLLAMPGFVPGAGLATKLVTLFPANTELGLPSHQGLVTLLDAETGTPLAVMGAEHLTAVRTAWGSAIATDLMARRDASVLAVVGAGTQGRAHLDALRSIRTWSDVRIWSRSRESAAALADSDPAATATDSIESALADADVVAMCTHADEPFFDVSLIAPGTHVSSVGFRRELPTGLAASARVAVEWRGVIGSPPPVGSLDLAGVAPDDVAEVGELLAGTRPARTSESEITLYKSVGHAAEDCAAAAAALRRAIELDLGGIFEL